MPAPLPPPLPPETRTVGQLVAEAIRLYGRRAWLAVPLGLAVAIADQLAIGRSVDGRVVAYAACAPLFALAYTGASRLVADEAPRPRALVTAAAVGTVVFLPAALLFPWFAIAAVAWVALVGLAVPAAALEGLGPLAALRRGFALGRTDYVHAAGALAALVVVFGLMRVLLAVLLHAQADNTARVAVFLADLVLSPLLFLGAALLYVDQEARSRIGKP